jgi:YD repeat-containing protein
MAYEEMALGFITKYDEEGNCIYKESACGNKKVWYKYDKNGNAIYRKELNAYDEQSTIDEYIWKYDKNNNIIYEKSIYYDLDEISEMYYSYDKNGRLIHIISTSSETVDEETWYKYDKYDNIIYSKTIDFLFNQIRIGQFIYDEDANEIYSRYTNIYINKNEKINIEYWIGYDENGNIVYRKCITNDNGKFSIKNNYEEYYIYDEYGCEIKEFHHDKNNDYYIKYNENGEMHKKWKNGDEEWYDKYGSLIKVKRIRNKTEIRIPVNIYY